MHLNVLSFVEKQPDLSEIFCVGITFICRFKTLNRMTIHKLLQNKYITIIRQLWKKLDISMSYG